MLLEDLKQCGLQDLEDIYVKESQIQIPEGIYKGTFLHWLKNGTEQSFGMRAFLSAGFKHSPFGVDFDRKLWFFFHGKFAMGRFTERMGKSRWRETNTVCLEYGVSNLPGFVRKKLYDEVKPLSDSLCLGMGGLNDLGEKGDMFFFALKKI